MCNTATLKIFLTKGMPTSVRTAEISNWTGFAVAGPRSQIEEMFSREEAKKPGVYFLSGVNPETGKDRIYIGESEDIQARFKNHNHLKKEFWNTLVFFVSKDENLTKAHIRYLEGKLIKKAKRIGRYELDNVDSSDASLPESDTADMEVFMYRMEQLLPILGLEFLKPIVTRDEGVDESDLLFCTIKGLMAKGKQTDNGFVVLEGSEAVLADRPSTLRYKYAGNLRATLRSEGILKQEDKRLVFVSDYEFSSPSAAASVIHGGHANGLTAWKDAQGVSLKEKEEKDIERPPAGGLLAAVQGSDEPPDELP